MLKCCYESKKQLDTNKIFIVVATTRTTVNLSGIYRYTAARLSYNLRVKTVKNTAKLEQAIWW